MAYLNTTSATGNTFAATAASFIQGQVLRYKRYRLFHRTLAELDTLSTRELNDLGLHRSALRNVAWEAVKDADL